MKKNKKLQRLFHNILSRVTNKIDLLYTIYLGNNNLYYRTEFEKNQFFELLDSIENDINEIYVRYRHSQEEKE